jgi:DNA-binding transcriptional LysR family regulator
MDKILRRFDLDLLHALIVVAETGSLSAAAPVLCRSQSAVSEQIRKLEGICGLSLLVRSKTGAVPTQAGAKLIDHGRRLLALNDAAYKDMQGIQLSGDLRFAITDYFRPRALPGILRLIRDQFPGLRLHVSIRKSADIENEAGSGAFDIGLSMRILDPRPEGLRDESRITLRRERLYWVSDKKFQMPEAGPLPLVVLPDTCSLQRFVIKSLDRHHVPYSIMHSASGIGGLHLALAAGLGVTCLNASAIPDDMVKWGADAQLPVLPEVEFSLVPPQEGEPTFIANVRDMLADHLG